jgi:steroid delta-isomerase-like uncharacterized protein
MDADANKAAERRLKESVWDRHDPDAADEFVHPDVVEHNAMTGESQGREGYKRTLRLAFAAFPDAELVVHDLIAEGDRVVERWTIRGTHQGEFMGIAATNSRLDLGGVDIYRYADGKRVETWSYFDRLELLRQLGVSPKQD